MRLLVVLPNWFGESLFATPFIRLLRQQNPDSFIAALGASAALEVLQGNPNLNLLIPFEETGSHHGLLGKWRLAQELRSHRFDTAIILRKSLSRTLLLLAAAIPARVGFSNPKSGWLLTKRVAAAEGLIHKARTYLPLLGAAPSDPAADSCDYTVSAQEKQQADVLMGENGLRPGFILLHIGANWAHKRWPSARFAKLADRLFQERQLQVAISAGPNEGEDAQAVQQQLQQPAILLAGKTTLRALAACSAQASVVVANDTGVLHIAAALARPVVALYGPTSPALTGPLGSPEKIIVVHHAQSCPRIPCYQPEHPDYPGMEAITVDEVYAAVSRLLKPSA